MSAMTVRTRDRGTLVRKSYEEGGWCPFAPRASSPGTSKGPTGLPITAENTVLNLLPRSYPQRGLQPMALIALVWGLLGSSAHIPLDCSSTGFHQRLLQAEWKVLVHFPPGHEASSTGSNKGPERKTQDVTDGFDKSTRTHSWPFLKQSS